MVMFLRSRREDLFISDGNLRIFLENINILLIKARLDFLRKYIFRLF